VTVDGVVHPFRFDGRGRTATAGGDEHVRQLVEQVLFTAPGERVNRPTFGCGVLQLVFAPNSDVLAAATQLTVQGALQQWLGDLIQLEGVEVESDDARLSVTVQYVVRRSQERRTETFSRPAGP
jgi:phage baseplate assembly protein W